MKHSRQPNPVQRPKTPDTQRWDVIRDHDNEVIIRNVGTKRAQKLVQELNNTGSAYRMRDTQPRPADWWHPHPGSF